MTRSCTKPATVRPRKAKPQSADLDAEGEETSDAWNVRLKRARALAAERDNAIASRKLMPTEEAIKHLGDVVSYLWLSTSNMCNTVPARCAGQPAEVIRAAMVASLNEAQAKVEEYLQELGQ